MQTNCLTRLQENQQAPSVAVTSPAVTQEVEEAPSTVNATYVAESATDALEPGEKIENLFTKNVTQDYILQKLTDRVWFFQVQFSGTMFYVGDEGVLLIDISSTPISRRSGLLGGRKLSRLPRHGRDGRVAGMGLPFGRPWQRRFS